MTGVFSKEERTYSLYIYIREVNGTGSSLDEGLLRWEHGTGHTESDVKTHENVYVGPRTSLVGRNSPIQ